MEVLVLIAFLAGAAATPTTAGDADIREMGCRVMRKDEAGKVVTVDAPDLHVLRGAAAEGPFRPKLPAGAQAIMCLRSSVIPAEHDDEVLALDLPLFLSEPGKTGRLMVLEVSGGQFRIRFLEGKLRPSEEPLIQARLDLFQDRIKRRK